VRYTLAAVVYVAAWACVLLTPLNDTPALATLVVIVVSVGAGLVARAWSIVAFSLAILPLAVAQPCELECDISVLTNAMLLWTPGSAALLAAGVALALRRQAA
jgi:hypothetical protein